MFRGSSWSTLALLLCFGGSSACLNQNSKNNTSTSSSSTGADESEGGDATMDGTMTNGDDGSGTDSASTMTDTGSTTMTDTDTGSTMTSGTDSDTDTGGIPDGLPPFLAEVFGVDPGDDLISQITDTVTMTPVANNTFLGDCSDIGMAKPETDIEFVWGTVVDSLPPLAGGNTMEVTPMGAPPLGGGPYLVLGFSTAGPMHLDDPNRSFTLGLPIRTTGKTGWTNMNYPCDFYIGFNVWPQVVGGADAGGNVTASLSLSVLQGGQPAAQSTTGRAFIMDGFIVMIIPTSELPASPDAFLGTIHTHAGDFFTDACADISSNMVGSGHAI